MKVNTTRFEVKGKHGTARLFSVDSQIMDYMEPARAFGIGDLADMPSKRYQPRLMALPDHGGDGSPMALALDRQGRLLLVRRGGAGSAGWERIDLAPGAALPGAGPVTAFGAAWDVDGDRPVATLAAAVLVDGRSRVFIAYDVAMRDADWHALDWCDHGGRDGLEVDAMRVWRDARGTWLTMLSASGASGQAPLLIRGDRPRTLDAATVFSPATDLGAILDLRAGAWRDNVPGDDCAVDSVLHILGSAADGRRVLFARPLEFDDAGAAQVTATYPFVAPAGANVLALGCDDGRGLGADLYVGGSGVQRIAAAEFPYQEQARQEVVIPAGLPAPVRRLLVTEDGGATSVWALLEGGELFTVRRATAADAWGEALRIRQGVADIAPGNAHGGALSGSVLVVYDEGEATWLWRDGAGIWQETVLVTADPDEAASVACLATNLCVMDGHGVAQPGIRVTLRTSVPASLVVNGRPCYLGPGAALTVRTGANGGLSIFNRALSFAPAVYRIAVDGMDDCLDVNPASALYQRFADLNPGQLRDATLPGSGEPLLAACRRSDADTSVDALAQTMRQAALLALGQDGAAPGVHVVAPTAPFSSAVSAARLPAGYGFGLAADADGKLAPLAAADGSGGGFLAWLGDSISDCLESIWNGVKQAAGFVVRVAGDVVEAICTVGDAVKRFVLSTFEEIGAFFEWAWDGVTSAVGKIWDYLKFLFDWGDIIDVRNTVADMIDDDLRALTGQVHSLREAVGAAFDSTLNAIQAKGAELGVKPSNRLAATPAARPVGEDPATGPGPGTDALGSGPGAWVMDQLDKLASQFIDIELPPPGVDEHAGDVASDLQARFGALCADLGEDAHTIFGGQDFKLADLDVDKLQRLVLAVSFRIAEQATAALRDVVLRMIDALAGMIDLFRRVLFARVRFPFIEKLLKLVAGADVDTSVRLVDIILLAPAVLTTITYKLVVGDTPPLAAVLAAKPAPAGALSAQSGGFDNERSFIKGVAGTYVSFAAICLDAVKAAQPVPEQKEAGKLEYLTWGLGFVAHSIGNLPLLGRDKPALTKACDWLMYTIGLLQSQAKFVALRKAHVISAETFLNFSAANATFHTVCYTLQLTLKTIGYLADDADDRDGWEFVQFCGRTGAQGVLQAARLVPEPVTKEIMVAAGMGAGLFLNLAPGLYRHAVALGKLPEPSPAAA